ncbi:unnamed protein product [Cyclocybe aegerita]|uniref:F-box domain-containing protein n=1 Tax=Cyclocybe aegerita TaxID=1973307 RepID=A0A8S0XNN7_CYCAE|nr:unnamed protein product [Cyclocybe aegerita]
MAVHESPPPPFPPTNSFALYPLRSIADTTRPTAPSTNSRPLPSFALTAAAHRLSFPPTKTANLNLNPQQQEPVMPPLRPQIPSHLRPRPHPPNAMAAARPRVLSSFLPRTTVSWLVTALQSPTVLASLLSFLSWADLHPLLCTCRSFRDTLFRDTALRDVVLARFVPGYARCLRYRDPNRYQDVPVSVHDLDLLLISQRTDQQLHRYPTHALRTLTALFPTFEDDQTSARLVALTQAHSRFVLLLQALAHSSAEPLEVEPEEIKPRARFMPLPVQSVRELTFPAPLAYTPNTSAQSTAPQTPAANVLGKGKSKHKQSRSADASSSTTPASTPHAHPHPRHDRLASLSLKLPAHGTRPSADSLSSMMMSSTSSGAKGRRLSIFARKSVTPPPPEEPRALKMYASSWRRAGSASASMSGGYGYGYGGGYGYDSVDEYGGFGGSLRGPPTRRLWSASGSASTNGNGRGNSRNGNASSDSSTSQSARSSIIGGHGRDSPSSSSYAPSPATTTTSSPFSSFPPSALPSSSSHSTTYPSSHPFSASNPTFHPSAHSFSPAYPSSPYPPSHPHTHPSPYPPPHSYHHLSLHDLRYATLRTRAPVLRVFVPTQAADDPGALEACERQLQAAGLWAHLSTGDVVCNFGYVPGAGTPNTSASTSAYGSNANGNANASSEDGSDEPITVGWRRSANSSNASAGGAEQRTWLLFNGAYLVPYTPPEVLPLADPLSLPSPFYYTHILPQGANPLFVIPRLPYGLGGRGGGSWGMESGQGEEEFDLRLVHSTTRVPSPHSAKGYALVRKYTWTARVVRPPRPPPKTSNTTSYTTTSTTGGPSANDVGEGWFGECVLEYEGTKEGRQTLVDALNGKDLGRRLWELVREKSGAGRVWLK